MDIRDDYILGVTGLETRVEEEPENGTLRFVLGLAYLKAGRLKEARKAFLHAAGTFPKSWLVRVFLDELHLSLGLTGDLPASLRFLPADSLAREDVACDVYLQFLEQSDQCDRARDIAFDMVHGGAKSRPPHRLLCRFAERGYEGVSWPQGFRQPDRCGTVTFHASRGSEATCGAKLYNTTAGSLVLATDSRPPGYSAALCDPGALVFAIAQHFGVERDGLVIVVHTEETALSAEDFTVLKLKHNGYGASGVRVTPISPQKATRLTGYPFVWPAPEV